MKKLVARKLGKKIRIYSHPRPTKKSVNYLLQRSMGLDPSKQIDDRSYIQQQIKFQTS